MPGDDSGEQDVSSRQKGKQKAPVEFVEDAAGSRKSPWFVFTPPMTTGSNVDDVTRDQIRRQAAHASSAQRVSTIQRMRAVGGKARRTRKKLNPTDLQRRSETPQNDIEEGRLPLRRSITDVSRRSSTAASSTESYSVSHPGTPFSAPSSPRDLVGAGRVDPFLSLPTENRHPLIPTLVDHFLTHFAPAPSPTSNLHGRDQMRLELWPVILGSPAMFDAVMLFTGTHLSICRGADSNIQKRQALWLRQTALTSINAAVADAMLTTLANDTIGAIAMLASWELEFGERSNFDIHMRVLRDVVMKRDGGPASLPPAIWHVVLTAGKALPSFASKTIYFDERHERLSVKDLTPQRPSTACTPGFAALRDQWLAQPCLCELVTGLISPNDGSEEARSRLSNVYEQLSTWDPYEVLGTSYCFLQTQMEDDVNAQGELHIIAAGIALCSAISNESDALDIDDADFGFADEHCSRLEPKLLVKTVYEELATWALFIVCAELTRQAPSRVYRGEPGDFTFDSRPVLQKLLNKLDDDNKQDWPAFERFLSRYAYPTHLQHFQSRCRRLWESIMEQSQHNQPVGAVSSASTVTDDISSPSSMASSNDPELSGLPTLVKSAARYRQGIRHPTAVVCD